MRQSDDPANIIRPSRRNLLLGTSTLVAASTLASSVLAQAQQAAPAAAPAAAAPSTRKPNILVIFGDDIGYWNIAKKKLKLNLTSEKTSSGRVYRIVESKPLVSSRKAAPELEQPHA